MKKKILIIIAVTFSVLAALAATAAALHYFNRWHIDIEGVGSDVTVECLDTYKLPEVKAYLRGNLYFKDGFEIEATREGDADSDKVGEYTVKWRAEKIGVSAEKSLTVNVVDTVKPEIVLVPEVREWILPGTKYDDPGFSASDNVDGDLTDKIVRTVVDETVTYTVSDLSGNETSVTREIPYDDPIPPELKLKGDAEITFIAGQAEYEEPGYTATDNLDGDITDRVKIDGEVDSATPGVYEIKYTVKDTYKNKASAKRTVTVEEPPPPPRPQLPQPDYDDPGTLPDKVIYLTFDDGPSIYTPELLDVLAKYNVKATFFVANPGRPDLIAREYAEGHSVGVHSLTHDYYTIYASEQAYFDDLWAMNEIIKEATGEYSCLLRFPGGSSNGVSRFNPGIMTRLTQAVTEAGFYYFDWNVSSGDAGDTTDTGVVYANVIGGVSGKNVSVVLQHDIKGFSVAAVENIIIWGLNNGYTFLPLTPNSPAIRHNVNN